MTKRDLTELYGRKYEEYTKTQLWEIALEHSKLIERLHKLPHKKPYEKPTVTPIEIPENKKTIKSIKEFDANYNNSWLDGLEPEGEGVVICGYRINLEIKKIDKKSV